MLKKNIKYHPNGKKYTEEYRNDNGAIHNEDGPAAIFYNQEGITYSTQYWVNNQLHNLNGAAVINFYDGVDHKEYYIYGTKIFVNDDEAFFKYVKHMCLS